ncbi:hypothetical protein [Mangrovibacterium lignilyticum]|uniref:hypothetical protein n=1 Tax=Mangrovibacterium lignilyticum TaxID=2668052 RepID=UPI0013D07EFB|nr:hypothetical protein [Mangrovibacterium lignilyticum]
MNIHITCTPEFSTDKLREVVELLAKIPGEMSFHYLEPFTVEQSLIINDKFANINTLQSLEFEVFFRYLSAVRLLNRIAQEDFLIVITSIQNCEEWFSAFNKKDVFVHGVEWDLISNVDAKFGIAHQCVENIFQSLIKLDIDNYETEPNIHMKSIGCINDFCDEKSEILIKLKSADICDSCYNRALKEGVSDNVIAHILEITEHIRKEFITSKRIRRKHQSDVIRIDSDGNVIIGERQVDMTELPKTLYIFFLKNPDGISRIDLCRRVEEVKQIYKVLKRDKFDSESISESITRMCCSKTKEGIKIEKFQSTLDKNKSMVKSALKTELGEILSSLYAINRVSLEDKTSVFKINISPDNVQIDPSFLEE